MKFKLVNDNSVNEALRIKRHRLSEEDSQGMSKFHMIYTVDGVKSEQDISAANIAKAEELVRKQYDGKNIIFTSKKPVQEDYNALDSFDAAHSIGRLNTGDIFKNRKGTIITIVEPTKDGRIQYRVGDEVRIGSENSIQNMLYQNNYMRISKWEKNLKEAYGYTITYDELIEIQGKIDRLIRKMADNHQDEISPSSNTYRIGLPFIGTREGYIDLQNMNQYIEGHEDDWDEDDDYDESLNEDKIADKVKSKQDPKEMTKKAIKMLKNLGGEYKDLAKEYKDTYGEDPLNESLKEDYKYVKRAFAFDIYKDGNDYVLLDGDGDEVYRADNTLDCLKYAKKNSSKYYKADMSFDNKSWENDFLHEDMEDSEKVLEADEKLPQTEETVGLSNAIIQEINGEWETIQHYNDLISIMRTEGQDDMINVISDIIDEENKHVGQLQKCLQMISPNVSEIDSGETEAIGQLNTIDNEVADDSSVDCADDDFGPNSGFDIYLV